MTGRPQRPRALVVGLLVTAALLAAIVILRLETHLTFVYDDWDLLVNRRDWNLGSFLDPYHEHIVLGPTIEFKTLASVFGIGSAVPFQVVSTAVFLLSAVALFFWLRPRIGDWGALVAAIAIMFLGDSFENLLWPIQIAYFGSIAAGIAALIGLDRKDRGGDRWACALLVVSMSFSSFGFPFLFGAVADIVFGRKPRAQRVFVVGVPVALYMLWYVGWGHTADSQTSLSHLSDAPKYMFDAASAGIVGLLGIATGDGTDPDQRHLVIGQIALVGLTFLGARRINSIGHPPRSLIVVLVIALSFWALAALNATADRPPASSRYLYPSAVFLLLIAGELLRGVRINRQALLVAGVVTFAAVLSSMSLMSDEYHARWITSSDYQRSSLSAIYIARDQIGPEFPIVFGATLRVPAGDFLDAVGDRGSPGFSDSELAEQDDVYRAAADTTLASALGLVLTPGSDSAGVSECQTLSPEDPVTLGPGAFSFENTGGETGELALGRFADGFPASFGELPAGSISNLRIPQDHSEVRWHAGLVGDTTFSVCEIPNV